MVPCSMTTVYVTNVCVLLVVVDTLPLVFSQDHVIQQLYWLFYWENMSHECVILLHYLQFVPVPLPTALQQLLIVVVVLVTGRVNNKLGNILLC